MTADPVQFPRVLLVAFQGWSDAGDATSEVLQHLTGLIGAEVIHVIGSEGYVDFQVHRPKVVQGENGRRTVEWPDTKLFGVVARPTAPSDFGARGNASAEITAPKIGIADAGEMIEGTDSSGSSSADDAESSEATPAPETAPAPETVTRLDGTPVTDLFLLAGVEPARDWQNFADEIVELVDVWAIDSVIILGSMFSDAPHSRPIAMTITSDSAEVRAETGAIESSYEGPIGIATVVELALMDAGIAPLTLWAQVPHYVHSSPSPKATLALLDKLEELLDIVIPRGDLLSQANDWEANINRIAAADEEMSSYIKRLEEHRDETLAAETTGDALALEFEKFLEGDTAADRFELPGNAAADSEDEDGRDQAPGGNEA